ncbi:uncharacterized protein LOC111695054 isoform X2 [Eurytemora carolleeae]|uniref:uncharacterized protein LOC111695054 isoform X2 n=1 Tax=Eurytemora carolleeae TaxID=1294199 RepID=UPI000C7561E8|nr:uncharacterized protein LOC111695054 isoform X2 [Eurytemora carolleeae]|eukprot:XP_023319975.1 uncharacterized protein LOC111695054 isoform X2 [Eurytemora affinis]
MFTKTLLMAFLMGVSAAEEFVNSDLTEGEGRFLYFNSSSTATSLTLLGAIILLGVIFYLVYVGGLLSPAASSGYAYNRNDYYNQYDQYNHARSASDGYDFNGLNVLQWISMLQEVYEKFDYNDLECQKKLICEVMQEKEQFGAVARNMKTGFEFAKYLEVLNMPDDFREILDEYMDASERSTGQKECTEVFECPYSIKDSIKRNFSGNSL